ncbi:hypothetical protein BDV10DRAFT_67618 [Aspergillus recurvatus]
MLRLIRPGSATPRNKSQNLARRYNLRVPCRVKPNASGGREGIIAVGNEKVDVCVAAAPRDGEANAALSRVFAKVTPIGLIRSFHNWRRLAGAQKSPPKTVRLIRMQVFNVAKSDVGVIHGLKSRDKVLCIFNLDIGTESEEEFVRRAGQQLQDAVIKK